MTETVFSNDGTNPHLGDKDYRIVKMIYVGLLGVSVAGLLCGLFVSHSVSKDIIKLTIIVWACVLICELLLFAVNKIFEYFGIRYRLIRSTVFTLLFLIPLFFLAATILPNDVSRVKQAKLLILAPWYIRSLPTEAPPYVIGEIIITIVLLLKDKYVTGRFRLMANIIVFLLLLACFYIIESSSIFSQADQILAGDDSC